MIATLIIGAFGGAALVFAAQQGIVPDLIGAAFISLLVAVMVAMALLLTGCTSSPRAGWIDIPTGFSDYPETVAPLSQAGCDGR